ncbi:RES family NAD+ phosphorylase [Yersinia intermedia]|uniref:RES domain-containing protein n=1 Tax=Yersinia intermedia TaxID=631 RepID=UPI00065D3510|nr:RES domain-containing protein [Yersinia intermedia]CRY84173.1 RES domain [Yersinia intermedia]
MNRDKYICHQCVNEKYIKKLIKHDGDKDNKCSYCEKKIITMSISNLADLFDDMMNVYYEPVLNNFKRDSTADDAYTIIIEELDVSEIVAEDILEALICDHDDYDFGYDDFGNEIGPKYSDDRSFTLITSRDGKLDNKWDEITNSLLTEARFFNNQAKEFLDVLFKDVHKYTTDNRNSIVHSYGTDKTLYRARVFDSLEEAGEALAHPEASLGPPPSSFAKSGRMNAQGIPVFYGATSPIIAIAEVRPTVGSYVITAPFHPLRELKVLDISALKSIRHADGSKFDSANREKFEQILFLKTLSNKLTHPIVGDVNGQEYLITQAVSEYLSLSNEFNLDGISFKSTQADINKTSEIDRNVVLFSKSAIVQYSKLESPKRNYTVNMYEHDDNSSYIYPTISLNDDLSGKKNSFMTSMKLGPKPVIYLDTEALVINYINGVSYDTDEYEVHRERDLDINLGVAGESEF